MTSQLDNPSSWATGNDAPTEKQKAFLTTLAADKDAPLDPSSMNKSEASSKINELKNAESKSPGAAAAGAPIQNPDTWTTGEEQATGKQTGYIAAMAREAGEKVETGGMGKTEASKTIGALKEKTGM
ncbi:hypothetical protein IMSHALPRED_000911 [Imshaugia aleurites]|uniref:Uncharacterized protein n=1 Tax=Imshaugia aleurites TaxID=172621 RepID=A0A8H3F2C9_9LECA|nr:hypothetical protein IMSHALPRED_000911 [Imshaugia aleurites]